ncbi:MAG: succinylglutamate desuccinylase/aspartoacylase family protein [Solirubrobacterales bacterium]|nr:succinylglutamate desuccinylase/aspartoacylase family protein [Solirubrobacterales bacterium]
MRRIRKAALLTSFVALAFASGLAPASPAAPAGLKKKVIGRSVENRPIISWRQGDFAAGFRVLVVGSIHGDERQGMRVVANLRQRLAGRNGPEGIAFWTIRTANPDGTASNTRRNARLVDLNRNFPYRWDGSLNGGYNSGPRPASEPETRTIMRFSRRVGFDLAIWFHQPWGRTLVPCNRDRRWAILYSRLSGLGTGGGCDRGSYPGSAISWQHHEYGTTAFVVELGPRVQKRAVIARHAGAVIRLARRMS